MAVKKHKKHVKQHKRHFRMAQMKNKKNNHLIPREVRNLQQKRPLELKHQKQKHPQHVNLPGQKSPKTKALCKKNLAVAKPSLKGEEDQLVKLLKENVQKGQKLP